MNPSTIPTPQLSPPIEMVTSSSLSSQKYQRLFLFAVLLVGLGSFAYSWVFGFSSLSGSLYVSLPNKAGLSSLYRYDLGDSSFTPLFSLGNNEGVVVEAVEQPKGNLTAFFNNRKAASGSVVRIFDSVSKKVYSLSSDNSTSLKEGLSWSPKGTLLAYAVLSKTAALGKDSPLSPESWGVFSSDLVGKRTLIKKGVSPLFISDDRLLVLKNDGLYVVGAQANALGRKIWGIVNGQGSSRMSLALSDDRKLLAWSSPSESKVHLFKVLNEETFELELVKTISALAYNPVFSPNGKFLAVHEITQTLQPESGTSETREPSGSLAIYNARSLKKRTVMSLPLIPSLGSISDWRDK